MPGIWRKLLRPVVYRRLRRAAVARPVSHLALLAAVHLSAQRPKDGASASKEATVEVGFGVNGRALCPAGSGAGIDSACV